MTDTFVHNVQMVMKMLMMIMIAASQSLRNKLIKFIIDREKRLYGSRRETRSNGLKLQGGKLKPKYKKEISITYWCSEMIPETL